jgi:RNA-directed DNA polymerase
MIARPEDLGGPRGQGQGRNPSMHGHGKSDGLVVPAKLPNNVARAVAEVVEERRPAKGNVASETRPGLSAGLSVTSELDRVRRVARKDKDARFTALLHHVTVDRLRAAYRAIRPSAAPGVDGVTWEDYGQELEGNLQDLHARVHRGAYRARPSRRVFIPKPGGRLRPLGVAALEDKILQRAVVEVLNAIYEEDFLGFSYGFRPGRRPHDALDALTVGIQRRKVGWVLDADLRDYFSSLDHSWLVKFLEHRIADKRVLRLIQKWLKAGVVEDGKWSEDVQGTPQGASVSAFLANVYLHYVFDLWVQQWRGQYAHGDVIAVRFADDFVVGFQRREYAERFQDDLRRRFAEFGLELNAKKTRLIAFGRFAASDRKACGLGKPETFEFLGFTHICAKAKNGSFKVQRITSKKRMQAKLREVKAELVRRRYLPIPEQGQWLASVVRGHSAYYAVPGNTKAIGAFRYRLVRIWLKALRGRSQRTSLTWERMYRYEARWLPHIRTQHPWPNARFDATHPRQEPSALAVHAGICAGGRS